MTAVRFGDRIKFQRDEGGEVIRETPPETGKSMEQLARDLLDRMEVPNAQNYSAGELTELANLIHFREAASKLITTIAPAAAELDELNRRFTTPGRVSLQGIEEEL